MAKNKKIKMNPATSKDKVGIACAEFAADHVKGEISIGTDHKFESELLQSLGFSLDNTGALTMKARDNDYIHIEEKTNEIKRVVAGKVVSSEKADKAKVERMIEKEKERIANQKDKAEAKNQKEDFISNTNTKIEEPKSTRRKARTSKSGDEER